MWDNFVSLYLGYRKIWKEKETGKHKIIVWISIYPLKIWYAPIHSETIPFPYLLTFPSVCLIYCYIPFPYILTFPSVCLIYCDIPFPYLLTFPSVCWIYCDIPFPCLLTFPSVCLIYCDIPFPYLLTFPCVHGCLKAKIFGN